MTHTKTSRRQLDKSTKDQIIGYILHGASVREAAAHFGVPKSTCHDIWTKFTTTGSTDNKPRSGRPKKLDSQAHELLVQLAREKRSLPLRELGKLVTPSICSRTVRKELAEEGLRRRRVRK
ncbi:hypothetical protein BDN72DRAFT_779126, partial [Pluteus cervinus]